MSTEIHSNALRSHTQFAIEDEHKVAAELIGKERVDEVETELMDIIIARVPKDDATERKFDIRWVLSCYTVYSEIKPVKEKEAPKKVPKSNGKDKKTEVDVKKATKEIVKNAVLKPEITKNAKKAETKKQVAENVKEVLLEDAAKKEASMDIKKNRPTSKNLVGNDFTDSEKNVVQQSI